MSGINAPAVAVAGQQLTVIMSVNNSGNSDVLDVFPSALTITGPPSSLVLASGPQPTSATSLAKGTAAVFTWVYNVVLPGTITFQGNASCNSGAIVSPLSISAGVSLLAAPTPTDTNTFTETITPFATPLFTGTPTPTPGDHIEIVTATPVLIYPNPNPVPGTTPGRSIDYTVNRPISGAEFRIYTRMGRLIRKAEDTVARNQGICTMNADGVYFHGLAKGVYYYIIIVTDKATGRQAKSPIEKFIVQ